MISLNNITPTAPSQHSRQVRMHIWPFLLGIVLLCISCLFLYVVTSPCSLRAQWDDFVGRVPAIPIPPQASVLSERTVDNRPLVTSDTQADVIGEVFITHASPATIVAFYEQYGAICRQDTLGPKPYWACEVPTSTFGSGWIEVFEAAAYREIPVDYNPEAYHLKPALVRPESHRRLTGVSPVMVATRRPCSRRPVHLGNWMCTVSRARHPPTYRHRSPQAPDFRSLGAEARRTDRLRGKETKR
jgi:hypothetical protein